MAFWLLLGLVYCLGLGLLLLSQAKRSLDWSSVWGGAGALVFSLGLGAELALGGKFNEHALRIFYLFRIMLPLAWLGHALLARFWPPRLHLRWLSLGFLLVSLAGFVLVWRTGITAAQGWFDPSRSVYGQYAETLATNRPTRGLVILLNGYGALMITVAVLWLGWVYRQRINRSTWLAFGALVLGEMGSLWPLIAKPVNLDLFLYLSESLSAGFLLAGLLYLFHSSNVDTFITEARGKLVAWIEKKA